MFDLLTQYCLAIGDGLLGWLLAWPRDLALVVLAWGSSAILTLTRRVTTNQNLLGRIAADRRRLKELLASAKAAGDAAALARLRLTKSQLAWLSLRAEGRPLLLALPPLALVATWCVHRLEFLPPLAGEPIAITAYTPFSWVGGVMHIAPAPGLRTAQWVQPIEPLTGGGPPQGSAAWVLDAAPTAEPYRLLFHSGRETCVQELLVGQRTYAPPVVTHRDQVTIECRLQPYRPFGVLPGIPQLLPPWMVGYLALAIVGVPILKRLWHVN